MKDRILHGGFIPTYTNMDPKEVALPPMSFNGDFDYGTMVMRIDKDTIWIFLPEGMHGLKFFPSLQIRGWCPFCVAETDAALFIEIHETVKGQTIACMNCSEWFKANPEIFKQAVAIYDPELDDNIFTNIDPEYTLGFQKLIKVKKLEKEQKEIQEQEALTKRWHDEAKVTRINRRVARAKLRKTKEESNE